MEFNIELLKKVNEIKFGTNREEVRNYFGKFQEFKKNKYSKNTSDQFDNFCVYYDENNKFLAIEIFSGNIVKIGNKQIMPLTIDELKSKFDNIKFNDELVSTEFSIGITEEEGDIYSILFGKKNYYL